MTKKKETKEKKTEEQMPVVDEKDARIAELTNQLQQVMQVANNHIALCKEYEKTIAILSGRIRVLNGD
tara:strand:+ start:13427 stop:13630 length:204 start_codon:yes stop_codon:yes gene_type:complete